MFRHIGKSRTMQHNIKLAALLSLVAGIVNVTGFFAVHKLTTNITGHFAFFADEVVQRNYQEALVYLFYILSFFVGAFCSSLLVEIVVRRNQRYIFIAPMLIEILLLLTISLQPHHAIINHPNLVACTLLFAMGLQNALVTSVSNSIVRTTHLTGLFTDLGIELSQLFFYKEAEKQKRLKSSIMLRFVIIVFFFSGCIIGGYAYFLYGIITLLLAVALLVLGLLYDSIKLSVVSIKRKYLH